MESADTCDKCFPPRGRFIFLMIINVLELSVGVILRTLAVFLWLRIYILFTRGLIFGLLIALLIVWNYEVKAEILKKTLIFSYTGMTLIDAAIMIILCVSVYDLHLYEKPDCKSTPEPCNVSLIFVLVIGFGSAFFLLKAIGLIFAFYRIHLMTKDREFKESKFMERLRSEEDLKEEADKKIDFEKKWAATKTKNKTKKTQEEHIKGSYE